MIEVKIKYDLLQFGHIQQWINMNIKDDEWKFNFEAIIDLTKGSHDTYKFENNEDAVLFKMRWG